MLNSLSESLGMEIFKSLRSSPFRVLLLDYGLPNKTIFRRGTILSLSLLLSKYIREKFPESRIGVILPPGMLGFVANFALFLCGRVPLNLNFTLGAKVNTQIMNDAGVKTILTASVLMQKFPDFPWPKNCILLDEFLREIASSRLLLIKTFLSAWLFPARVIRQYQVISQGGESTAALLFTSGSSGVPKGVPLSHVNLLENCRQLHGLKLFDNQAKVLVNLPLFHSFGMTVGMIFSTLRGLLLVSTPSPLDHRLNIRAIYEEKVQILLGTPTFLRGYLKKASAKELGSIRYVVAGAEKSPSSFRKRWESENNCEYLEGYGLTEASPAISFNLPGKGKKSGSVGRLLKGVECRTIDPVDGSETDTKKGGVLCFRGPNIFSGYWLDEKSTNEALDSQGWLKTGDVGRIDADGFLWIEGRISRFSKIGGEMVPHARIEEEILDLMGFSSSEEQVLVVTAVQDDQKGEKLVVVSTLKLDQIKIRQALSSRQIPKIWIPKHFIEVKKIPVLPSGKIDWLGVQKTFTRQDR